MHITRSAAIAAALTLVVLLGVVAAAPIVTPRSRLTASARVEAADALTLPPEIPMTRFDFENGSLDGWKTVDGRWAVEEMTEAPSGKRVLVQRATANAFNVIVAPGGPYTDVDVSMRFKPISGREDASGGIVFRFAEGRYYVVRANALEDNLTFYYYDRGRREIASARVVQESDDVTIISSGGLVLRLKVKDIGASGRGTRGFRLMNLASGDGVASVARFSLEDLKKSGAVDARGGNGSGDAPA